MTMTRPDNIKESTVVLSAHESGGLHGVRMLGCRIAPPNMRHTGLEGET
jgi:hypothetical protein